MIRTLSRLAAGLRGADRRLGARLGARARHSSTGDDSGFVLLESLVVIGLITVVMAAFTTFFVGAITSTSHQRALQTATQLANSNVELIRGLPTSTLVTGHDASSVGDQFNAAPASVAPSLLLMTQAIDTATPAPAVGTGRSAKIPTVAVPQALNNIAYSVNIYLGTCTILTASPVACGVAPGAGIPYLRAVVAVTWRDSTCQAPKATCVYMTSTLMSQASESCVYFLQTKPDLAVIDPNVPTLANPNPSLFRWTVGSTRNLQLMATGNVGTANLSWALTGAGALPPGLALSPSGLISGSATAISATPLIPVTVKVTDACGRSATFPFTPSAVGVPTISPTNQTSPINTVLTYAVPNTCPDTPCVFTAVNLPVGLTINASTGVVSGTPTTPGTVTVTVTVTDSDGMPATGSFTWSVVSPASVCVQSIALPQGGFEAPVRSPGADTNFLHGNGVTPGLLWNTTAPDNTIEYWHNGGNVQDNNGGLAISAQDGDQWAELNANGVGALYQDLVTVPGQVLQWSVYHRARYVGNTSGLDVMQVQIGSSTSQSPQVPTGQATANISDGPLTWVHYTGVYTVPAGQTTTRFQFAAISTSSGNQTVGNFIDNLSLNNNIACLVTPTIDQASTVNTAIAPLSIAVDRGTGPFTWNVTNPLLNPLPNGLVISTDGVITGTPTVVGSFAVILTFSDATAFAQTVSFNWTVYPKPTINKPANQVDSVGSTVNLILTKSCSDAPCTYVLNNGPPGLTVTNAGVVTGAITGSAQVFNTASVTMTDAAGAFATTANFTWTVLAAPTIVTPAAQATTLGATVNLTAAFTCADSPCTFALTNGPPGLTINASTGAITGSPTLTGTYTAVTITITDVDGSDATTANFTWTVYAAPTVTKPGPQNSTVGTPVNLPVAYTCGNSPCTFALAGAPAGLSINVNTGVITGTPTTAGTSSSVIVTITDKSSNSVGTGTFTWTVYARPTVTSPGNQTSQVGSTVNLTLTKSCPNAQCSYVLNNGPAGLMITAAGVVTGTITGSAQVFSNVSITITDSATASATSGVFSWTVTARPTVTAPTNQTDSVGSTVNLTLTKSCPNAPCNYLLNSGPPGLTITSAGVVTGTITGSAQTFNNVTVTITDSLGASATSTAFSWTVLAAPTVTTPPAQRTTVNAAVNLTVASTCADAPCTFTLVGAPPGLSISSSGVITGTPTTTGTYTTVRVGISDVDGSTATTANFTWTVTGPPTITSPGNTTLSTNQPVNQSLPYTCPNGPCTFTTVNLPPGIAIDNQGNVSGTATTVGTYNNVTISVTDASGVRVTTPAFTVTVIGPPSAPTSPAATGGSGQIAVSWTAPANNGSAITGYTATSSPGGATCSTTATACTITGLANGTTYTITITATNGVGTGPPSSAVSATTTASCTSVAVGTNAYLAYPFNEAGGLVAADVSGNNRPGTYTSAGVTYGAPGPCPRDGAKAVTLNGSSGYISSNVAPVNPQVFTEAIWFKTTVAGGKLIGYGNAKTGLSGQDDRHIYMTSTGTLVFGVYPGTAKVITSPASYNNGAWHQAIATLAPSTDANPGMRLYVDGRLVAFDTTTTSAEVTSGVSYWRIGYDNLNGWPSSTSNYFFTGSLAFAATYAYAATPAQAQAQYNAGI